MAGIGEASSLVAIIEAAVQVAREAAELCQNFKDAPRQLQSVSGRTAFIHALLQELESVRDELSFSEILPKSCQEIVARALRLTWNTITEIQRARDKHIDPYKVATRLKWAFLGKKTTDALLESLHNAELELVMAMNLIQCRTESIIFSSITKLQLTLDERLSASDLSTDDAAFQNSTSLILAHDRVKCSPTHLKTSYTSADRTVLQKLGIHGCFISYSCQNGRRYHLILRFPLLRSTAFIFELGMRIIPATGSGIDIFRHHLSLRNVVAETSPIMIASRQRDLQTVKTLFETRDASPFDITEDGETLLELAVESCNEHLVAFLLENGADPNTIIDGNSGMSVLQQALSDHSPNIARLLLRWGACRWHVDSSGWANMFYIWARPHADNRHSQHCLKLLLSECYPSLTSYDSRNFTALHRAASFGSVEDVQLLLRNGANPLASINGWTPAFYANCFRNHLVIPALIEAGLDVNYQDGGGWTLLHLAAKSRSRPLLDCLFRLGADLHIKGAPDHLYWKQFHEKSQVIGQGERHATPLDVARGHGEECYNDFLLAARKAGIDISWDSEGDAFWPAEENVSAR